MRMRTSSPGSDHSTSDCLAVRRSSPSGRTSIRRTRIRPPTSGQYSSLLRIAPSQTCSLSTVPTSPEESRNTSSPYGQCATTVPHSTGPRPTSSGLSTADRPFPDGFYRMPHAGCGILRYWLATVPGHVQDGIVSGLKLVCRVCVGGRASCG